MQFTFKSTCFNKLSTIEFETSLCTLKTPALISLSKSLQIIGGESLAKNIDIWEFPKNVNSETIKIIIRNTCFVCGGLMKDSVAYQNTIVSFPDFGKDAGSRGTTQSRVGEAIIIDVRKCVDCGHSHT